MSKGVARPVDVTHGAHENLLSGEAGLLAAVLVRAIADVRARNASYPQRAQEATVFLQTPDQVERFTDALNLDFSYVYPRLLAEAGLEE